MKHEKRIASCHRRAAACVEQAVFIAERLQSFPLVCPFTPCADAITGIVTPVIHAYSKSGCEREFGAEGWTAIDAELRPGAYHKLVDGMMISYDVGYDENP